jgi:hypothetical protein
VGCIDLAQDKEQWRALVNTVMNLRVPKKYWEFLEYLRDWWLVKEDSE